MRFDARLLGAQLAGHRHLVRFEQPGATAIDAVLSSEHPVWSVDSNRADASTFVDYLRLGVDHLWTGVDHLLFLLALRCPASALATC